MPWLIKRRKQKILSSLKIICAALLSLSPVACSGATVPAWNGRLFFGDYDRGGLSRNHPKDPDFISCAIPEDRERFDDMVCMSGADFKSFLDTYIGRCEKWKAPRSGDIFISRELFIELLTGRAAR